MVTGGSSGLGEAVARRLAGLGAAVAVVARRADRLAEVAAAIGGVAVRHDLLDLAGTAAVVTQVADALGPPEILVCAAGNRFSTDRAEHEALGDVLRTVHLNLVAPLCMAQAVHPHMAALGRGAVVLISSIGGRVGVPGIPQASYAASKMGLSGLAAELAVQWAAQGVRVNTVAPGFFRSEITDSLYRDDRGRAWLDRHTPLRVVADADDVAATVAFLVGDQARYITGQTVVVDGGWTAR